MVGIAAGGVSGDVVAGHVRDVGSDSMSSGNFFCHILINRSLFYILDHCLIWTCLYFGLISDF